MQGAALEFDLLHLCGALERSAGGVTAAELQAFCYLGALASLYAGQEAEQWLYQFNATPAGAPYSKALADTLDGLRARGLILDVPAVGRAAAPAAAVVPRRERQRWPTPTVLALSDRGREEYRELSRFASCAARARFLEAAGATTLTQPLASVTDALSYEPGLRRALERLTPTALLKDSSLHGALDQFAVLRDALGPNVAGEGDLLVPISIWLSFLSERAEAEASAA
jgi:hypothetical protein